MSSSPRRVAVIGSGVAGLTAAYVLRTAAEVTLYEADGRCGGHAHTHDVATGDGVVCVDSGFLVHNRRNYPLLCRLFDELGVDTQATEMSLSVACDECGLEYCGGRGPAGLFGRRRNLASPRFWSLLAQVRRFHRRARRLLASGEDPTLGRFLAAGGYSRYFVHHFIRPLVSAVWSCSPGRVSDYPARYLFAFLANHGMLSVGGSPRWRTVCGGSRSYVERIVKQIPVVRTSTPVTSVESSSDDVAVGDALGGRDRFDAVVVAVHADQALAMLAEPSDRERRVLGAFEYSRNPALLHTDSSVLPRHSGARGSWNHRLPRCVGDDRPVRVAYHLNRLHDLSVDTDLVVTLGDTDRVADSTVLARMEYRHPIYTAASVAAQRDLHSLNTDRIAFAGSYHGWGFHEDGCRSGVAAAASLGVDW